MTTVQNRMNAFDLSESSKDCARCGKESDHKIEYTTIVQRDSYITDKYIFWVPGCQSCTSEYEHAKNSATYAIVIGVFIGFAGLVPAAFVNNPIIQWSSVAIGLIGAYWYIKKNYKRTGVSDFEKEIKIWIKKNHPDKWQLIE